MELKPSYKRSEAGVVPQDWLDYAVGDLIEFEGGSQPDKSVFRSSWKPGYIRLIQIRDYKTDKYEIYVPTNLARRFCIENDIMIGRYGPPIFQILRGLSGAYNVALIKAIPGPEIDRSYAYYFLKQDKLFAFIEKLSQRSSGQTGVDLKELRAYPLPLPPTKAEQEAIAEALSDADALIESLAQLIAKKRQIKQGAMQELLTGKKRLPGFSGSGNKNSEIGEIPREWRVVEIGEIANVKTGPFGSSLHEHDYVDDGTPIITVEHLGERGVVHANLPMVSNEDRKRLSAYSLEEGDIVFSRVGSVDRNARISNAEQGWLFSGRLLRLRRLQGSVDTHYLSYQFHSEPFKQRVRTVAVGQTMASLNTRILKNVLIALPSLPEQTDIAAILADMDAEIAVLEEKLTKARQVKQGMMQELLTGRIRLGKTTPP